MIDLWDALGYGFMQRAYLTGATAGIVCPLIGTFLVQRRLALIADGLGHASFAGVAAGLLLGVHPLASALVVALAGALGIERLQATRRAAGDVAIAVTASLGLGLGIVLVQLAGGVNVDLFAFLFGSLVAVSPADLGWVLALGLVVVGAVTLLYKELFSITTDEEAARAAGIPVEGLNVALVLLTALTVIVGMRAVGILLVTALMVLPVATGLQLARGFARAAWYAVGFGVLSALAGLTGAYLLDLPAGGAVVLVSVGLFAAVSLLPWLRRLLRAQPAPEYGGGGPHA